MHLQSKEQEKLLAVVAADLARRHQQRGLKLNYPVVSFYRVPARTPDMLCHPEPRPPAGYALEIVKSQYAPPVDA